MTDYKSLFYKSQAVIADAIDMIEKLSYQLSEFMVKCEDEVISDENEPEQE